MSDDPLSGPIGQEIPLPAENTSGAEEAIPGYRPSGFNDGGETIRERGYSWAQIHDHLAQSTLAAMDYGYSENEIDRHLGFNDPAPFEDAARSTWAKQMAQDPTILEGLVLAEPRLDLAAIPTMRQDYAQALLNGDVKGPQDFAYRYGAAALNAAHELHGVDASDPDAMRLRRQVVANAAGEMIAMLPTREDLADATVSLSGGNPGDAQNARQKLMDQWAITGTRVIDIAGRAQASPSYAEQIMGGIGQALHDVGPLGDFLRDLGFGVAAGFTFPREEFEARYSPDRLLEALRQGPEPNLSEHIGAALTRLLTLPGRNAAEFILDYAPELTQRFFAGEGITPLEALTLASAAFTPFRAWPGGVLPPRPEILPPYEPNQLRGPPGGVPGAPGGPIIEHEAAAGPLVRLPPPPPLEVIDLEAPPGTPRQLIAPREALGPVPAQDRAIHTAAEELSNVPSAEREAKLQRLAGLELENTAPEGGGTFFQRILQQQIERGEITPQAAAAIEEPKPQQLLDLAEGYDAAKSLFQHFYGIIGEVLKDESGAVSIRTALGLFKWSTPDQQAYWDTWARSRDIAHRILIPNIMKGVKNDVQLARMMDSYRGDIAPYVNEFARASRTSDGMAMVDSEIGKFLGYVENKTWGGVLRNSKLQPLADALAAIAQHGRQQMNDATAEGLIDPQAEIDNWYKHLWKNPHGVNWDGLMAAHGGGGGSASFMRARSLPTMFDGMKAGLSPLFDNPIDQALYGEHLRSHYLNSLRSIKEALREGEAYWDYGPHTEGDIKLEGIKPDFSGPLGKAPGGNQPPAEFAMHLYAKPGFARPYNNRFAQGMDAHPVSSSLYNRMLWATNMSTAVKLIWPGFHMRVMGLASVATGIGQAFDEASRGEIFKAFKHLGVAVGPGLAVGTFALAAGGVPVAAALAGIVGPTVARDLWVGFRSIYRYNRGINDPIVTALADAGLRFTPRQHFQHMGAESLMTTAKRGGFIPMQGKWDAVGGLQEIVREIGRDIQQIGGDRRIEGPGYRLAMAPFRAGIGLPLQEAGRVMMTATSPLFDYSIPALRAGALYNRYASWLETHMNATDQEKWLYARQLVRDGENRFGELNQDTRFAPRLAKQIANVSMVSPGWKWGSWSGFAAAIGQDPERGTRWGKWIGPTLYTSSLVGTLTAFMIQNAVLQVAYGQPPFWKTDTAIADLLNGRTGGQSKLGGPGRRMDPAEIKEYYDAAKVIFTSIYSPKDMAPASVEYVMNAMNPAMHALIGTLFGKDGVSRFARSVYDRPGGYPAFLQEVFGPITANAMLHPPPGSILTPFDRFMGTRDAAQWVTDWQKYIQNEEKHHERTMKEELRRDQGPAPKRERQGRQPRRQVGTVNGIPIE